MTCSKRPKIHTQLNNGQPTAEFDCGVEATIRSLDFASCGRVKLDEDVIRRRMGLPGQKPTNPRDWKKAIEHPDTAAEFAAVGLRPPKARLLDGVPISIAEDELRADKLVSAALYYQPLNVAKPPLSGSREFNDNHAISYLTLTVTALHKEFTEAFDSLYDGREREVAGELIRYPKGPQRFPWALVKTMCAELHVRTRDAQGHILTERKLGKGLFLGISVARAKPIAKPAPQPDPAPVPETDAQKIARLEQRVVALESDVAKLSVSAEQALQRAADGQAALSSAALVVATVQGQLADLKDSIDSAVEDQT